MLTGDRPPLQLHDAVIVHDLPTDKRQERSGALQVFVGNGEAVSVEYNEIGMVTDLDGADILLPDKPFVGGRSKPERLLAREHLVAEDRLPSEIPASNDCVQIQPRIDDRDVAAVGVVAL